MEGYVYQSVCVVTGADGAPVVGLPDAESAAVLAESLGEGAGIATVPVVNLPWYPVQPQAEPDAEQEVPDGE